jgi:hypothetical protein
MSHVHPIQEKKVTIKAFKKLKYIVYRLDRDNVGQYLILDTAHKPFLLPSFVGQMFFQSQSARELFALAFPYHCKIYLQLSQIYCEVLENI